jgi:hypothetical protein
MPVALLGLAMFGHRPDSVYERFLWIFREGMGVAPPAATLFLATAFYTVAAYRAVPMASGFAMASLVALSVVGPETLDPWGLVWPRAWPLLPVALVQGWLAYLRKNSFRALLASGCLVASTSGLLGDSWSLEQMGLVAFHLALVAVLVLGAIFDDYLGRHLRSWGAVFLVAASLMSLSNEYHLKAGIPPAMVQYYPIVMTAVACGYGLIVGGWPYFAASAAILSGVLAVYGHRGYLLLRQQVAGLDRIAWGMASFAVAALISLWKAGMLQSWLTKARPPDASAQPASGQQGA